MFQNNNLIQLNNNNELSNVSQAQASLAEIQMSYMIAYQVPRNVEQARVNILAACKRKRFADTAIYRKPMGKGKYVEGLTIRTAEEILRVWGNMRSDVTTLFDDERTRRISVRVIDLQSNSGYTDEITITKTKERKAVKEGDEIISERRNSKNEVVYIVKSTNDDVLNKQRAETSKSIRNYVLKLIPSDLREEIEETVRKTLLGEIKNNINESRKGISDAFYSIGIEPVELEKYLGQKIKSINESQIVDLRRLYVALREGEITWKSVISQECSEDSHNNEDNIDRKSVDITKITKSKKGGDKKKELFANQEKLWDTLVELCGGDEIAAKKELKQVGGYENIEDISEAKAAELYKKSKEALEEYRKKNDM